MLLGQSVSDEEISRAVEGIDAAQMLLVIDSCNSGQALEGEEKLLALDITERSSMTEYFLKNFFTRKLLTSLILFLCLTPSSMDRAFGQGRQGIEGDELRQLLNQIRKLQQESLRKN